jgi:anti-anti-sigma factor
MLQPRVHVSDRQGVLVAEFWDCLRLDPAPVQELFRKYETTWPRLGRADLIVDFLGVDFAGSTALSGLVRLQKLCRQSGGRLVLCNLCPTVHEVFRLSRLVPLFTFVADRPAALALLGGNRDDAERPRGAAEVAPQANPPDPIDPGALPHGTGPEP